ncbi:MAG: class I SAM-dependent methyltransferase, partial [Planctomycetota bacterium]
MDEHLEANRELWETMTPIHLRAASYDVPGFKAGRCTLPQLVLDEVGDVSGRSLLHLQCHFGLDTLSWARKGATVTGADFSENAISAARSLASELGIAAEFVCCNIYDLPDHLVGEFDVVFTSMGVLHWLPDIENWARVVSHFARRGGFFYIYEHHPSAGVFDDDPAATEPRVKYPYFKTGEPLRFEGGATYASGETFEPRVSYEWPFSLSEVVNSLVSEGLRIEFLHEFPHITYKSHAWLEEGADGLWRCREKPDL